LLCYKLHLHKFFFLKEKKKKKKENATFAV